MQIISDENCQYNVVAVSVSQSFNPQERKTNGRLRDCTQGTWPLSKAKKDLVEKLLAEGQPIFIVPYCTERSPLCPLEDSRVVKGVYRLDHFEGFRDSNRTYSRGHQKRTLFMLNELKSGECDIRVGQHLRIDKGKTNYPVLMGPWKEKNK